VADSAIQDLVEAKKNLERKATADRRQRKAEHTLAQEQIEALQVQIRQTLSEKSSTITANADVEARHRAVCAQLQLDRDKAFADCAALRHQADDEKKRLVVLMV
jgi:hypothetical protein